MNKKYINPKTGKKYHYYSRKGVGYEDVLDWAKDFEPPKNKEAREEWYKKVRIVKQEHTWMGFWISTVWLGLDHAFGENQPPLIFETMVFFRGKSDLDMDRYTTERQAKAGHEHMVALWSNPFYVIYRFIESKTWYPRWKLRNFFNKIRHEKS